MGDNEAQSMWDEIEDDLSDDADESSARYTIDDLKYLLDTCRKYDAPPRAQDNE